MGDAKVVEKMEMLLVSRMTSDPFATCVVDPQSGVSQWSLKGSELQGAESGVVEPLGEAGECLVMAAKDRPVVHVVGMNPRGRLHVRSTVSSPLRCLAALPCGEVLFGAANTEIFTWLVSTGELLSVVNAHYQRICCLQLTSDGKSLVSGAEDGSLKVFAVNDLMQFGGGLESVKALREWRPHSLAVTGIACAGTPNTRVLSCAADHTAALYSISLDDCLLKFSCDKPLTACCIDSAESQVFFGTSTGAILQFELFSTEGKYEHLLVAGYSGDGERGASLGRPPGGFDDHEGEIRCLSVNADGTTLAVGDSEGRFSVFDIASRQCITNGVKKGAITKLSFIPNWETIRTEEFSKGKPTIGVLQRTRNTDPNEKKKLLLLPVKVPGVWNWNEKMDCLDEIDSLLLENRQPLGERTKGCVYERLQQEAEKIVTDTLTIPSTLQITKPSGMLFSSGKMGNSGKGNVFDNFQTPRKTKMLRKSLKMNDIMSLSGKLRVGKVGESNKKRKRRVQEEMEGETEEKHRRSEKVSGAADGETIEEGEDVADGQKTEISEAGKGTGKRTKSKRKPEGRVMKLGERMKNFMKDERIALGDPPASDDVDTLREHLRVMQRYNRRVNLVYLSLRKLDEKTAAAEGAGKATET